MTSPLSVVGTKALTSFNMELDKFMEGIMGCNYRIRKGAGEAPSRCAWNRNPDFGLNADALCLSPST